MQALRIVREARSILNSKGMAELRAAAEAGQSASVKIGGRTITYDPGKFSAMTNFEQGSFHLGREAFKSSAELTKTVLQELYRLNTSSVTSGAALGGGTATAETNAAFQFAERAYKIGHTLGIW